MIGVGESESGFTGQKNIEFSEIVSKVYEDLNMVGPWVIEYGESEFSVRFSKF